MLESTLLALAKKWGVSLDVEADALQLTALDGSVWVLEKPTSSSVFTLYTYLDVRLGDQQDYQSWLSLNGQRDRLGCAWIAYQSNQLCLGVTLPKEIIDETQLEHLFENLHALRRDVSTYQPSEQKVVSDLNTHTHSSIAFV